MGHLHGQTITPVSSPRRWNGTVSRRGTDHRLVRTISRGCATALDAADDTDNSAADFSIGTPIGRNNAATPTEKPCTGTTTTTKQKKCKKKNKQSSGAYSAKKKCKKKKKRH